MEKQYSQVSVCVLRGKRERKKKIVHFIFIFTAHMHVTTCIVVKGHECPLAGGGKVGKNICPRRLLNNLGITGWAGQKALKHALMCGTVPTTLHSEGHVGGLRNMDEHQTLFIYYMLVSGRPSKFIQASTVKPAKKTKCLACLPSTVCPEAKFVR